MNSYISTLLINVGSWLFLGVVADVAAVVVAGVVVEAAEVATVV